MYYFYVNCELGTRVNKYALHKETTNYLFFQYCVDLY